MRWFISILSFLGQRTSSPSPLGYVTVPKLEFSKEKSAADSNPQFLNLCCCQHPVVAGITFVAGVSAVSGVPALSGVHAVAGIPSCCWHYICCWRLCCLWGSCSFWRPCSCWHTFLLLALHLLLASLLSLVLLLFLASMQLLAYLLVAGITFVAGVSAVSGVTTVSGVHAVAGIRYVAGITFVAGVSGVPGVNTVSGVHACNYWNSYCCWHPCCCWLASLMMGFLAFAGLPASCWRSYMLLVEPMEFQSSLLHGSSRNFRRPNQESLMVSRWPWSSGWRFRSYRVGKGLASKIEILYRLGECNSRVKVMGKIFRCKNGASNLKKRRNAGFFSLGSGKRKEYI